MLDADAVSAGRIVQKDVSKCQYVIGKFLRFFCRADINPVIFWAWDCKLGDIYLLEPINGELP